MSTKHLRGPWRWLVNAKTKQAILVTDHSGEMFVMGFVRNGHQGAQPMFQVQSPGGGHMVPLFEGIGTLTTEPDHNGYVAVTHPDATLIAAAPEMLAALEKCAGFLATWRDTLDGVQMSTADFQSESGLYEARIAIEKATAGATP